MGDTYELHGPGHTTINMDLIGSWFDNTTNAPATQLPGVDDTVVFGPLGTSVSGSLNVGTVDVTPFAAVVETDPAGTFLAYNMQIDGSLRMQQGYLAARNMALTGSVTLDPTATELPTTPGGLPLPSAATIEFLTMATGATLNIGAHNVQLFSIDNANEGTGNAFTPRSGIVGTGVFEQPGGENPAGLLTPNPLESQTLDFGIVHVGDTAIRTVTVTDLQGDSGGYPLHGWFQTNGLTNPDLTATPTEFNILGRGGHATMDVTLAATHAGDLAGQHVEASALFGMVGGPVVAVPITGTVNNYAAPAFTLDGAPDGTTTWEAHPGMGVVWAGVVQQGAALGPISLGMENAATGPADALTAITWDWQDGSFTDSGVTPGFNLAAGQHQGAETVQMDTSVAGWHWDTVVMQGLGGNASGYMGATPTITDTVFVFVQSPV